MRSRKRNHSRWCRKLALCLILVFATAAGGTAYIMVYGWPAPIQARLDIRPEPRARQGTLYTGETKEVEDGSYWVLLNQLPTIGEGAKECRIQYENSTSNHYSSRISLYLEETGKLLGSTTRVDPGYYVEWISLKQKLPPGEYPLTARIELFENREPAGEMAVGITLRVTETEEEGGKS